MIKCMQDPGKICVQHLYQIYIHGHCPWSVGWGFLWSDKEMKKLSWHCWSMADHWLTRLNKKTCWHNMNSIHNKNNNSTITPPSAVIVIMVSTTLAYLWLTSLIIVTPFVSQWANGLCICREIKSTQGPQSWISSGQAKKRQLVCNNLGILNSLPCHCLLPPLHSSKPLFSLPSVFEPHLFSWLISLDKDILCIAHLIYLIDIW